MFFDRPMYYDRQGMPMGLMEWARAMEDMNYKRVASTYIGEHIWVSTVWLGADHNWSFTGAPIIFETMVFHEMDEPWIAPSGREFTWDGTEQWRYATEQDAIAGHAAVVRSLFAPDTIAELEHDDEA